MVEADGQSEARSWALNRLHLGLFLLLLLELLLRMAALRLQFFHSALNDLDLAALVLFIPAFFVSDLWAYHLFNPALLGLLRIGRVVAVLGPWRWARPIRAQLCGFVAAFPALLNAGLLLLLLLLTYAFLGMCAFAHRGALQDDLFGFGTIGSSLLTLMMVSPSSYWDGLLHRILDAPDYYSPAGPILFFTSYVLLQALLLPALFLAAIVELFPGREGPHGPQEDQQMSQEASGPGGGAMNPEGGGAMNLKGGGAMNPEGGGAMNPEGGGAMNPEGGGAMNPEGGGAL
ncbi:sodium channel protein type 4 subunit alpha B-like [Menidia menidia]